MRKETNIKTRAERQAEVELWDTLTDAQKMLEAMNTDDKEFLEDLSVTIEGIGKIIRSPKTKTEEVIEFCDLLDGLTRATRQCCGRILADARRSLKEAEDGYSSF